MWRFLGHLSWCASVALLLGGMYGRMYGWTPHHAIAPTGMVVAGIGLLLVGGLFHGAAEKSGGQTKDAA